MYICRRMWKTKEFLPRARAIVRRACARAACIKLVQTKKKHCAQRHSAQAGTFAAFLYNINIYIYMYKHLVSRLTPSDPIYLNMYKYIYILVCKVLMFFSNRSGCLQIFFLLQCVIIIKSEREHEKECCGIYIPMCIYILTKLERFKAVYLYIPIYLYV